MASRNFHLGDILSVITGRTLSPDNIHGIGRLMAFMLNREIGDVEIPDLMEECRSALIEQHPQLLSAELDSAIRELLEKIRTQENKNDDRDKALAMECVDRLAATFGTQLAVKQIEKCSELSTPSQFPFGLPGI